MLLLPITVLSVSVFIVGAVPQHVIFPNYRPDIYRPIIVHPTYRPIEQKPIIRFARDTTSDKYDGSTIFGGKANVIDFNGHSVGSEESLTKKSDNGKEDYNKRFTRSIRPYSYTPYSPVKPIKIPPPPSPFNLNPRPNIRTVRDIYTPGFNKKKTSHHQVIIPNWNPNVRTKPWQHISVKKQ